MSSLNTTSRTYSWLSLFYLLCWLVLCHDILLVFCCVFIFALIIPWSCVTFLLAFSFSITFLYFTILTNIWTVRSEMPLLITTITDNIWEIIICRTIFRICGFIFGCFLTIVCWLWWFCSGMIWLLSSWWTIICKMTRLFTTITDYLIGSSIGRWNRCWIWMIMRIGSLKLQNICQIVMFLHCFTNLIKPYAFSFC